MSAPERGVLGPGSGHGSPARLVKEVPMTDPGPARAEPQRAAGERVMLEEWLDYHRATLRRKCAGLDDEQLRRRSCEPSDMSLLGLVRHLTDVERGWFLRGVAGQAAEQVPALYYSDEDPKATSAMSRRLTARPSSPHSTRRSPTSARPPPALTWTARSATSGRHARSAGSTCT